MNTRLRSVLTAATVSLSLLNASAPASAAAFTDISGNANATAILYLNARNIIGGYPDGSFKPRNTINRAELAKILVGASGASPVFSDYSNCFSDVGTEWFAPYVCYAKSKGWVSGYADGTFLPANPVNTAEALKMILNAQGIAATGSSADNTYSDVSASAWFTGFVQTANHKGLLQTTSGTLGVGANMTRGSVAETIYRSMSIKDSGADRFGAASGSSSPPASSSSSQAAVIDTKRKYTNGTFSAIGQYYSPEGPEQVQVSLTLKDDNIADATFQGTSGSGRSRQYMQAFSEGFKEVVIGQPIDTLSLSVVNGSSLTPRGFMDAVAKIKLQAKA